MFSAAGRGTGVAKSRAAVHLDGDWHLAFHCWIVRRAGTEVVLQRRSLVKDTFAGFWDASAAGHWRFGESPEQAAREVAEELGLRVAFSAFTYRGRERLSRHYDNGLIDREHHQVYVLECDAPLLSYHPDPGEVSALAAVTVAELVGLLAGRREVAPAREAVTVGDDGRLTPAALELRRETVVPYSAARMRRILGPRQRDC